MLDICFWCGKNQCRLQHTKAIKTYRRRLHEDVMRRLIADGFLQDKSKPLHVGKIDTNSSLKVILPRFTKRERQNINNYKPRWKTLWGRKESREEKILKKYGY